ncbi:MAG TPA: hypothetical protein VHX61_02350 [Rhizomicrobium sp.]|jgi:Cft2 family RNA processing exonuclease|nr:hypothetical protein [Rhizomicrobium sp.]
MTRPADLLRSTPAGLCCVPGDFVIDPVRPVERAVITHGHGDHARPGHGEVLATRETLAIMEARYGEDFAGSAQPARYGETTSHNGVEVTLVPAGHVLGSAQIVLRWKGITAVVSGDYKRRRDPTCLPFEPVPCDVFVSEATFGLPVFRHPDDAGEIAKLLKSVAQFPDRAHLVGAYALGKAQRLICLLREAGYDRTIFIHGALAKLNATIAGTPAGCLPGNREGQPHPTRPENATRVPAFMSRDLRCHEARLAENDCSAPASEDAGEVDSVGCALLVAVCGLALLTSGIGDLLRGHAVRGSGYLLPGALLAVVGAARS